jgi:hypothetical protein
VSELAFLRHYYRGEVFDEWLAMLHQRGGAHGSELVHALGSPRGDQPGMTDNVNTAVRFLSVAVAEGVIIRGKFQPTPEQQFFDVNRSFYHTPDDAWEAYFYTLAAAPANRDPGKHKT